MFLILGGAYFVMMYAGHMLLKKPEGWVENKAADDGFNVMSMFKNKTFVGIWLIFYINIHCGLMLIPYEKQLLNDRFAALAILPLIVSIVPSVTALCNALGRIGYSTVSDKMKDRALVYNIIFISCILVTLLTRLLPFGMLVIVMLMVINLGYGGGFSTLPALLDSRFGMKNISKIHGLALSAWAVAGITGNNLSEIILNHSNKDYNVVIVVAAALYAIALLICAALVNRKKNAEA
jgi:OFA family oxalate/formate antiporter-like MFS transporter